MLNALKLIAIDLFLLTFLVLAIKMTISS